MFAVFVLSGLAVASWMARIPDVRDHLTLTPSELGRTLLVGAVGSFLALPTAGLVVNRFGPARSVAAGAVLGGAGLAAVGVGAGPVASVWLVMPGLFACGYGIAVWDVAMNVEGADVERGLNRALMPRLHAGFSLGSVAGAGLGAAAAWSRISVAAHLSLIGAVVVAAVVLAVRYFLRRSATTGHDPGDRARSRLRDAWREPRTLLIGVLVLTFALAEGVANEWLAVGLVDGFDVSPAVGAAGFAVFVTAMTATRILGGTLIDRWGRVPVLRGSAVGAIAGVLLVVFGGTLPVALIGVVVWGAGAALGFPMGMSAGADDPDRAAIRVSVVSSIGYTAFLMGPPLLGWLGDRVGVHRALLVVAVAMVVGAVVAVGARRPRVAERRTPAAADPVADGVGQ